MIEYTKDQLIAKIEQMNRQETHVLRPELYTELHDRLFVMQQEERAPFLAYKEQS